MRTTTRQGALAHVHIHSTGRKPAIGIGAVAVPLMLWVAPAGAQSVAPAATAEDRAQQSSVETLPPMSVTGFRLLFEDTSGITNLPLPVEKVPQSISIVDEDFVKAADLKTMGEIAQHTTGGSWASYSPSYGNQIWLRGFAANFAINGLTVGDQITDPDPAVLARYEIVKGPASVVYGAQSPGGIVNLVEKSASPNTPSYLEVQAGSWGRWRVEGQSVKTLGESGTVRGIGVAAYEEGGSFVDFVNKSRSVVYGGLDAELASNLTGYVRASFQRTADTPFNGIPTFANGTLPPVSRAFFLGASNFQAVADATRVDAGLTWDLSNLWTLDLKSIYQYTTHGGQNAYNYSAINTDGSFTIGGENFNDWNVQDYTTAASATRKLDDLGLKDSSVSASLRYQHYRYDIYELGLSGTGTPNIFNGDSSVSNVFNALTPNPNSSYQQDQRMNYLTASSQAVIKVASPLTLVGGVAYSQPKIEQQVNSGSFKDFNPGDQTNYRGALIFEATRALNLYASYSESYLPNLRVDTNFNVLAPVKGKQYELGAKYLPNDTLLMTAALFDIRESNVAVFDKQVGIEALYRAEDVRHKGVELEATGRLTRDWQIRGGLAFLDPRVTNDPENPVNNGETRPWLPRTTAHLYTIYDVNGRLSIGGGTRYVGSIKTYDNSSAVATPPVSGYWVFDTAMNYTADRWHVQLNLRNIFDRHYYVPTPIFQSLAAGLYPGEPRSFSVSVRRDL